MAADVGEEELQRVGGAGERLGAQTAASASSRFRSSALLFSSSSSVRWPTSSPIVSSSRVSCSTSSSFELVLEHERLELGGLDEAALLGALDQALICSDSSSSVQLVLRQVGVSVLSRASAAHNLC